MSYSRNVFLLVTKKFKNKKQKFKNKKQKFKMENTKKNESSDEAIVKNLNELLKNMDKSEKKEMLDKLKVVVEQAKRRKEFKVNYGA